MTNKFRLFLVFLFALLLLVLPTFLNLERILSGKCYLIYYWPFCDANTYLYQSVLQMMFVLITTSIFAYAGYLVFKKIKQGSVNNYPWSLIILSIFIITAFAFLMTPFTSSDIVFYYNYGKAVSGQINPYLGSFSYFNPYIIQDSTITSGFVYGPIMCYIFKAMYQLAQGELMKFVILWKLLQIIALVLINFIIYKLMGIMKVAIDKKMLVLFLFTQPLLLWEWVGNGHFDGLWLVFLLMAILLAHINKWWLALASLTIGIWIKLIPIFILPWFALWWWQGIDKKNWPNKTLEIIIGITLSVFITIISWYEFWEGAKTLDSIFLFSKWAVQSTFSVVYFSLKPLFFSIIQINPHFILTRVAHLIVLAVAIYYIWPYFRQIYSIILKRTKWSEIEYLNAIFVSLLIYLLIWQKVIWPWYFIWLMPIGVIIYLKSRNIYIGKILLWISLAPLFFYIPWMFSNGNPTGLKFFIYSFFLMILYPLYCLYKWRKNLYKI